MAPTIPRPPFDPMLQGDIVAMNLPDILDLERLREMAEMFPPEDILKIYPDLEHTEYTAPPGDSDAVGVTLSVYRSKTSTSTKRPCLYSIHGGGQTSGNRFSALHLIMSYFDNIDVVFVSVEYRLAPEHPASAALNDCYTGLTWTADHAEELDIDATKIMVCGGSGGGPLAAASVLTARNKQHPKVYAQMLLTPMLDDRDITVSSKQFHTGSPWCGITNTAAWDMVLGNKRGTSTVSELLAPARATDLSGLPPTFIDAGECEVFRDEAVAYALKMWECGSSAELHIWPGAHHGFDLLGSKTPVSHDSVAAKVAWIRRMFGYAGKTKV